MLHCSKTKKPKREKVNLDGHIEYAGGNGRGHRITTGHRIASLRGIAALTSAQPLAEALQFLLGGLQGRERGGSRLQLITDSTHFVGQRGEESEGERG